MRIIPASQFATQAWKNGGGVTHEIARREENGALLWRLSIAEVERDGPFSLFNGLSRILTVIDGAGIDLVSSAGTLKARPLKPVAFSGDSVIDGRLVASAIRDFNVIFDGTRISADVSIGRDPVDLPLLDPPGQRGVLALSGTILLNGIAMEAGSFAFFLGGAVAPQSGSTALLVSLQAR